MPRSGSQAGQAIMPLSTLLGNHPGGTHTKASEKALPGPKEQETGRGHKHAGEIQIRGTEPTTLFICTVMNYSKRLQQGDKGISPTVKHLLKPEE